MTHKAEGKECLLYMLSPITALALLKAAATDCAGLRRWPA